MKRWEYHYMMALLFFIAGTQEMFPVYVRIMWDGLACLRVLNGLVSYWAEKYQ